MVLRRALIAITFLLGSAPAAMADCDPFPQNALLGNVSHAEAKTYVSRAHDGDWAPYIGLLQDNLERLTALYGKGEGAVLNVKGTPTRVDDNELSRLIYASRQFISVASCLAERQMLTALGNFETAAGKSAPASSTVSSSRPARSAAMNAPDLDGSVISLESEVASLSSDPLRVRITSECGADGSTKFVVANLGGAWPATAVFGLFRITGQEPQMIGARRTALDAGETKTFRISERQNLTGRVGIAIEPSWYSRPFVMDADARCR